jgi:hypothetical protein
VYVLRQNCRAAGWRWDSEFKIIHVNGLKQWKEENILNHCKDLHLILTNDKDQNDHDIV